MPVTFVPMVAVHADSGLIQASEERTLGAVRKGYTSFSEGDVIFAKITPCMENGKAAIAHGLTNGRGFGSTEFHVLKPGADVLPEWIFYFVRQESFRQDAKANFTGTAGQLRVPASFLENYSIPLPPLAEQHRIVEAIEQQLTRLDAGVASLRHAQAGLRRYKAAVLKAACEGRLVPQAPGDEPADALLRRILDERRTKWEAEQIAKMQAQGRMILDDGWRARYQESQGPDTAGLPELPKGWCWASLQSLCSSISDGDHQPPPKSSDGIPFLVIGNVSDGYLDFTATRFVPPEYYDSLEEVRTPARNDILYTVTGSFGIPIRVETDREFCVQRHIAILRPLGSFDRKYLWIALSSDFVFAQAVGCATGTAQKTVPLGGLREFIIPLPPLAEQQRIVAEVERRLSVVAEVEAAVAANLKRTERLRQAILKRAFEGKLVPQDPSDEPASALLERIRRERERETGRRGDKETPGRKAKQLRMEGM